ncbi:MAG: hypothetical protein IT438_07955 [Phycisphaerales bacterium]|nr:hypothetical protein [Phycisphaerales bacterium]
MPPTPPTTDRDLLALEPALFRDIAFLGQVLFRNNVSLTSGVLTAAAGSFADSQLAPGHIIVIDDLPLEILERSSATTAVISLLRAEIDAPPIVPANFTARPGLVVTFAPQIALIHAELLHLLGLSNPAEGDPTEADILNPADLRRAEALGTLHLIYSAAGALVGPDSPAGRRADMYRLRFNAERRRLRIHLDTDGDGQADAIRTPAVTPLIR